MKTYIINLDRDQKRWNHIRDQALAVGLDFKRISGVSGRDLDQTERDRHYSSSRARWLRARDLSPSEIGCALSHLKTYREILCRDLPRALILEDDVILSAEVPDVLSALEDLLPQEDPIICLLSPAVFRPSPALADLGGDHALRQFQSGYFTSSYIVTQAAAAWLLNTLYPVSDVADCWARLERSGQIRILCVTPALIEQDQETFGSSTTTDIQAALKAPGRIAGAYKLRRARNILFGTLVGRMRTASTGIDARAPLHPIDSLKD